MSNGIQSAPQRFGYRMEKYVASELTRRGHYVKVIPNFYAKYDLLIDGQLPVEVKASLPYSQSNGVGAIRDRWQFNLAGGLDANKTDFLYILVAIDRNGEIFTYLVPSAWTVGRSRTPAITSHPGKYKGWLSQGLQQWQHVDMVSCWRQQYTSSGLQMTLPIFV